MNRVVVIISCLVELALVGIGESAIVVTSGIVRIETDRVGKVADRGLVQLLIIKGLPAVKICFRIDRRRWLWYRQRFACGPISGADKTFSTEIAKLRF